MGAQLENNVFKEYIKTGITGFDNLFSRGIPKGSSVLLAGGTGSGKTNFCLQILNNQASLGKKCFYISFEESGERIKQHMQDFGWDPNKLINEGNLKIKRFLTNEIYYDDKKSSNEDIQAMMAKEADPILMELEPFAFTEDVGFKPDFIVIDTLTAISSSFTGKEQSYRFYIERLFRFFEKINCTTFLIVETKQIPKIYSPTGVEEFLADGVIVLYNYRKGNTRDTAIEILKMRGEKHQKKIVEMKITDLGVSVYSDNEVSDIPDS
jgi:KaiC/GvpD/RAD55 family RecA-like ATPase